VRKLVEIDTESIKVWPRYHHGERPRWC